MRNCTLYLDEQPVIVDGDVVVDSMRDAAQSEPAVELLS